MAIGPAGVLIPYPVRIRCRSKEGRYIVCTIRSVRIVARIMRLQAWTINAEIVKKGLMIPEAKQPGRLLLIRSLEHHHIVLRKWQSDQVPRISGFSTKRI